MHRTKTCVLLLAILFVFLGANVIAGLTQQPTEFPKAAFGQDGGAALSILYSGETRGNLGTCG